MRLSKEELGILSDCIIFRMEKMLESKKSFSGFGDALSEMDDCIKKLKDINNKICEGM